MRFDFKEMEIIRISIQSLTKIIYEYICIKEKNTNIVLNIVGFK